MGQQPIARAAVWIQLGDVGEREDIRRVEEVQVRVAIPRGLCESMIEASPAASRNVRHHAVEDFPVRLILIETVVQIGAQETSALRNSERDRALDVALP